MELNPVWEFVTDGVMGGESTGGLSREDVAGRQAMRLIGDVSLANDGGFVQMAFDLRDGGGAFDASDFDAIALEVYGNDEPYDLRLRTDQLEKPWQSFRTDFVAKREWQMLTVPFADFEAHRTDASFDPAHLRRVGVLGIGREFHADVAVASVRLITL